MKSTFYAFSLGFLALFTGNTAFSQGLAVNTSGSVPATSAMLDVTSTSKGMLIPRMTNAQRNAISSPATALMVYQTDATAGFYYYDGSAWTAIGGGAPSGAAGGGLAGSYPSPTIATGAVGIAQHSATGTANSTTYLRGDNTWATVSSGGVTSITAGTGLSGGTITTTGTVSMPNVGTAGTYGSATQVPVLTTDAQGRVTGVTNTTITAGGSGFSWAGGGNPANSTTVTTIYCMPNMYTQNIGTTNNTIGFVGYPMPQACTLDAINLTGYISSPGAAAETMTITVYKNEAPTTMTLSITFPSGSPLGTILPNVSTTANPVSLAIGDRLAIVISNPNPSVAFQSGILKWGLHFQ